MAASTIPFALIVDDEPLILMDLEEILGRAGFRCHAADNGDVALETLAEHEQEITLLFSDVEMPGETNGFALARHVATEYPWIEIVISSGRISPKAGEMPQGATFIGKPFSAQMVIDHLQEILPDGKKPEPLINAV